MIVVILLSNICSLLSNACVVNGFSQIELDFADEIITLQKISVVSHESECLGVFVTDLVWVLKSIVEFTISIKASIMRISLLWVLLVKVSFEEHVGAALCILALYFLTLEYNDSYLKFLFRLWLNVPYRIGGFQVTRDNIDPASKITLVARGRGMIKRSCFDRLVQKRLPLVWIESILNINDSEPNHIITKNFIHIHKLDFQAWATWEFSTELNLLINTWVRLICLVFISEVLHDTT